MYNIIFLDILSVINKINDQKNLIERNFKIIRRNTDGNNQENVIEKKNVIKKIGMLVKIIRNLKKKIKIYKNEAY